MQLLWHKIVVAHKVRASDSTVGYEPTAACSFLRFLILCSSFAPPQLDSTLGNRASYSHMLCFSKVSQSGHCVRAPPGCCSLRIPLRRLSSSTAALMLLLLYSCSERARECEPAAARHSSRARQNDLVSIL
jgi:hypothetical protein